MAFEATECTQTERYQRDDDDASNLVRILLLKSGNKRRRIGMRNRPEP